MYERPSAGSLTGTYCISAGTARGPRKPHDVRVMSSHCSVALQHDNVTGVHPEMRDTCKHVMSNHEKHPMRIIMIMMINHDFVPHVSHIFHDFDDVVRAF